MQTTHLVNRHNCASASGRKLVIDNKRTDTVRDNQWPVKSSAPNWTGSWKTILTSTTWRRAENSRQTSQDLQANAQAKNARDNRRRHAVVDRSATTVEQSGAVQLGTIAHELLESFTIVHTLANTGRKYCVVEISFERPLPVMQTQGWCREDAFVRQMRSWLSYVLLEA